MLPRLFAPRFLRTCVAALLSVMLAAAMTACSGESGGGDPKTINLLTYETYHDPAWLDEFTQATGIKVNATTVGAPPELFAKLKADPERFDVVVTTSGWYDEFARADLLEPIDASMVTNSPDPGFDWKSVTSSGGAQYGVLYNWGDQPLAWLDGSIPNDPALAKYMDSEGRPNDWNILWDQAFAGKVSVFDDVTSVLPMIPMALGLPDPYHLDDQQFGEVKSKLDALRPQIKRLTSGYNDQASQFTTGEATIGYLNIISEVAMLRDQGVTLKVNHEIKQGVPAWSDAYSITKAGAQKADSVYKLINYSTDVPWQARFIAATGNSGTLSLEQAKSAKAVEAGLTPELLNTTLIPATASGETFFKNLKFFEPVEDLNKRVELWNQFKLGVT